MSDPSPDPVASTDTPEEFALAAAKTKGEGIVVCDACPVLCRIRPGKTGACDRYGNIEGKLARLDPFVVTQRTIDQEGRMVPFLEAPWNGEIVPGGGTFVTGIGAGTTYPDYKPAPFIVSSAVDGVDMITVVTEGIFSYCGVKAKIDTDRYVGPEQAAVRVGGEQVGHVTTAEYGSQMLSLGGVRHLTGGSKKEGVVTCETLLTLCNKGAIEMTVDGGASLTIQAGKPPVINGTAEERMRVGCGSATIGIFAKQWQGHADEVIVVDDHITGVLSEHQAGRFLDMRPAGIRVRGRKSTPGRYFQVANPGTGWGGTDITDPLAIIEKIDAKTAWPGLRLLMVSTTGEHAAWFVLDGALRPQPAGMPAAIERVVSRIGENCEPALTTVLFMAGAGGSLRAGVTENPVQLTRSVRHALTRVTSGGAPVFIWPGGGITYMVDVTAMPDNSFGYVPTPAIVGPIEFTMTRASYAALGGHIDCIQPVELIRAVERVKSIPLVARQPLAAEAAGGRGSMTVQASLLPGGRRLHLNHGPIDAVIEGWGEPREVRAAYDQVLASFHDVLPTLVKELPTLRWPLSETAPAVQGVVARRMVAACWPFRNSFITPMAAVAGAVADHLLTAMLVGRTLSRAYVNDGGDIAFHLAAGERLTCGVVGNVLAPAIDGKIELTADLPVRGIATSGAATKGTGGRSFSLGIADAVTVLARDAAAADAAATVIGNAVDLPGHSSVIRRPAFDIDPDSDLGGRQVTLAVGTLATTEIEIALTAGLAEAERQRQAGLIYGAVLTLQGRFLVCGDRSKMMQAA